MYVQYLNKQKHKNNNEDSLRKMTFTPVRYILKLLGLCCVSSDGKKLKYSWSIWRVAFTSTALLVANSMSVYLSLTTITYKRAKAAFQDYIPSIYLLGYVQYIVDLACVYKYGRQRCLNYYKTFENIDNVIGMPYYNEVKKSVAKICIFFILIGSCYLISDYTALVISYGWSITTIHSIDYVYTVIKMLSALDGIAHFTQVKFRLKRMEDILKQYYVTIASLPGVTKDVICEKVSTKTYQTLNGLDSLSIIGHDHPKVILQLSRCYVLLLEQCDYINGMFGFRILLGGLVYLMEMVMLSNLLVRFTMGTMCLSGESTNYLVSMPEVMADTFTWFFAHISATDYPNYTKNYTAPRVPFFESGIFPLLSTTMKIVKYSSVLLWGINCCEQTYRQCDKIVRCIDHLLANKRLTIEEDEALKELRELIITRPVRFSAVNFYTLDYPAMLSMASAVVTYTIILLQNLQ